MKLTKTQERTRTQLSAFIQAGHPIAVAVETLRAAAVARAEERANEKIKEIIADFQSHKWDIQQVAPYPDSFKMSRSEWATKEAKYDLYHRLTELAGEYSGRRGQPVYVQMKTSRVQEYVKDAKEAAAIQYDAFVIKLIRKVGEVVSAACEAQAGVWGLSYLRIVRKDGSRETWQTQQIINYSVLGTPYNQWPTRKLKRAH